MNLPVILSRRAQREVREITAWYAQRSGTSQVADRWVTGFFDMLDDIQRDPLRHPRADESNDLDEDIREVHYGSGRRKTHRILYRFLDDAVEVIGVRHYAQRNLTSDDL